MLGACRRLYAMVGLPPTVELDKLDLDATRVAMRRLRKTKPATWSIGTRSTIPDSDGNALEVDGRDWAETTTPAAKDKWIADYSDHPLQFFVIEKV